jgi:hypothetical protein
VPVFFGKLAVVLADEVVPVPERLSLGHPAVPVARAACTGRRREREDERELDGGERAIKARTRSRKETVDWGHR